MRRVIKVLVPIFPLILLFAVLLSSCATAAEIAPKINFILPPGNIYGIGDIPVSVSVANFTIVDKQGQPAAAGEGHLHYYLDVPAPTDQGKPAVAASGTWTTTAATTYTWHNVGSGTHTISVELVNNDHPPLNPPVVATMNVVVVPELGAPRAVIVQPRDGARFSSGNIDVLVEVNNFSLVPNTGQTSASGEGHILYFLDTVAPTNPGKPATTDPGTYASSSLTKNTWQNLAAGSHTLSIELVNDDDTPLTPAIVATVTVVVTP
jgi:hypothetical protein